MDTNNYKQPTSKNDAKSYWKPIPKEFQKNDLAGGRWLEESNKLPINLSKGFSLLNVLRRY